MSMFNFTTKNNSSHELSLPANLVWSKQLSLNDNLFAVSSECAFFQVEESIMGLKLSSDKIAIQSPDNIQVYRINNVLEELIHAESEYGAISGNGSTYFLSTEDGKRIDNNKIPNEFTVYYEDEQHYILGSKSKILICDKEFNIREEKEGIFPECSTFSMNYALKYVARTKVKINGKSFMGSKLKCYDFANGTLAWEQPFEFKLSKNFVITKDHAICFEQVPSDKLIQLFNLRILNIVSGKELCFLENCIGDVEKLWFAFSDDKIVVERIDPELITENNEGWCLECYDLKTGDFIWKQKSLDYVQGRMTACKKTLWAIELTYIYHHPNQNDKTCYHLTVRDIDNGEILSREIISNTNLNSLNGNCKDYKKNESINMFNASLVGTDSGYLVISDQQNFALCYQANSSNN